MGDSQSIVEELYRSSLPRLCAYGFLLTGSEAEGEELVQAAIVKTFARHRRLETRAAAEGYVRAAMRTLAIDAGRRATRWRKAMTSQVSGAGGSMEDHVAGDDAWRGPCGSCRRACAWWWRCATPMT